MKNIKTLTIIFSLALFFSLGFVSLIVPRETRGVTNLGAAANTVPNFVVASSTTFSVTTTSKQLLASSTPTRRVAATIQLINCAASSGSLFLLANRDAPATANTGIAVFASSTMQFTDYPYTPVPQGAVQGIVSPGTCSVLVTEWRTQY